MTVPLAPLPENRLRLSKGTDCFAASPIAGHVSCHHLTQTRVGQLRIDMRSAPSGSAPSPKPAFSVLVLRRETARTRFSVPASASRARVLLLSSQLLNQSTRSVEPETGGEPGNREVTRYEICHSFLQFFWRATAVLPNLKLQLLCSLRLSQFLRSRPLSPFHLPFTRPSPPTQDPPQTVQTCSD